MYGQYLSISGKSCGQVIQNSIIGNWWSTGGKLLWPPVEIDQICKIVDPNLATLLLSHNRSLTSGQICRDILFHEKRGFGSFTVDKTSIFWKWFRNLTALIWIYCFYNHSLLKYFGFQNWMVHAVNTWDLNAGIAICIVWTKEINSIFWRSDCFKIYHSHRWSPVARWGGGSGHQWTTSGSAMAAGGIPIVSVRAKNPVLAAFDPSKNFPAHQMILP